MAFRIDQIDWLTPRRLRAHGIILAVCLWSVYFWNLSTPGLRDRGANLKGADFLHFYTLGSLAKMHAGADLYDMNAQAALAAHRIPQAAGIRYLPLYPPQVSLIFLPLSYLSYGWALAVWWCVSAGSYGLCCFFVWRSFPALKAYGFLVVLLAVADPAFFHLIAWGQTSALALACFTLMYFFLLDRRDLLAGIALGCLIFKPQLALAAVIIFLVSGAWKILVGASISAAALMSLGVFYYGLQPFRTWLLMMWKVGSLLHLFEPKPYQTHCLRTFWSMLIPWDYISLPLYALSAALVLAITIAVWKSTAPFSLRYSALLLTTVLIAPHLTVYDLVILAPAMILLADWFVAQKANPLRWRMGTALYFVYLLPLMGPLARWSHVQLSVIAMAVTVYLTWRLSLESKAVVLDERRVEAIGTP